MSRGRRTGLWYKWKRDPLTADCVLMYAQRGSGKRSSYYSATTPSAAGPRRASCFRSARRISASPTRNCAGSTAGSAATRVQRFGPVREVEKSLVLEVAFDSIHKSTRHKSGLAMRFPRISRIRIDKPAAEADRVATLQAMVT